MQNCPNCGHENMEGIVFCQACGMALVPVPLSTRQLAGEGERSGTGTLSDDGVVMLHVEGEELPVTVQLRKNLVLGRFNEPSKEDDTSYFDLTSHAAEERGVSRRHAQLKRDGSTLYLTDLNSTNGTKVNGETLAPSVEQQIHDGDEITLGRLKVYIYFRH